MKADLKEKAISLRREGKTYSEILKDIPVAKSTLSLWFHEVELAVYQKQRITQKRIDGQKKAAQARRNQRIQSQNTIWSAAEKEITSISERELWLVGIALYWAEGSKEKEWSRGGGGMKFSNSDPRMIRVFMAWSKIFAKIPVESLRFELYIHETKKESVSAIMEFWSKETGLHLSYFNKVYFKRNIIMTKRKNTGVLYNGQLRVSIPKSTALMRWVEGWVRGIDNNCRIV